jgi:hypothetical protein
VIDWYQKSDRRIDMRLSELNKIIKSISKEDNPEIRIVGDGGFLKIDEILPRSSYHDENFLSGTEFEKGNFVCVEVVRR